MKHILAALLIMIIIGIGIGFMIAVVQKADKEISNAYDDYNEFRSIIGKSIIMKSDTLEIVNANYANSEVTLSDGVTVSYEYAETKLIEE